MPPRILVALALIASLIISAQTYAEIINVPDDEDTITLGMEAADDGDTVLVAPGEYIENLRYWGKEIVVGSWLLLYPDSLFYIEETIIDGNGADVVVAIYNDNENEGPNTELRGFTIQNGYQGWGGGVEVRNGASPILADLIVKDNHVETGGGGLYFSGGAGEEIGGEPKIYRCKIFDNTAGDWGAGVGVAHEYNPYFEDCEIYDNIADDEDFTTKGGGVFIGHVESYGTFVRCLIRDNFADEGGAIYFENSFDCFFYNCTIVNNVAGETAGAMYSDYRGAEAGFAEFRNCIFWNNGDSSFYMRCSDNDSSTLLLAYNCIEDGEDAIIIEEDDEEVVIIEWEDGNIDDDPIFLDPDELDFTLSPRSPCIDSGDPDFDQDPDNTRADMGYKYFDQFTLRIMHGFVTENDSGEPIEGARVETSRFQYSFTDSTGYYLIRELIGDTLGLTATALYYEDVVVEEFPIEGDTTEVDLTMKSGDFSLGSESIEAMSTMGGDSVSTDLILANTGEFALSWESELRLPVDIAPEKWEELDKIYTDELLSDIGLRGVTLVGDIFYLSGPDQRDMHGGNQIYMVDREGVLVGQFDQPQPQVRTGMIDITWDGEMLWGIVDDSLYGLTEESVEVAVATQEDALTVIAWDEMHELFWASNLSGDLYGIDTDGMNVDTVGSVDMRVSGLAVWQDDPDGHTLYVYGYDSADSSRVKLLKLNVETGAILESAVFGMGDSFGACIVERLDDRSVAFISVNEFDDDERALSIRHIEDDMFWLGMEPMMGEIALDSEATVSVYFLPPALTGMTPELWEGRILFSHTTPEMYTELPVSIDVVHGVSESFDAVPTTFGITATYPNPFNSNLRIEYDLPEQADVTLSLYSVDGRLVETLVGGRISAGRYAKVIQAENMPSGVYFVRLNADNRQSIRKIALVR